MVVPLKVLRRFERVKTVIQKRDEHWRALGEVRDLSDRLAAERDELQARNATMAAQIATLESRHAELQDNHIGIAQEKVKLQSEYENLARDRDRLAVENTKFVEGVSGDRWLVKKTDELLLLLDKGSLVDLHVFYHNIWEEDRVDFLIEKMNSVQATTNLHIYFFDIGAYFGQYSLLVQRRISQARVFAFEANTHNFIQLTANLLLNDFVDKITPVNCCVTDQDGQTLVFAPDAINKGAARIGERHAGLEESTQPKPVRNLVIDKQFSDLSNVTIFMKIDIEGSELSALHGMKSTFQANRVFMQIEDWDFPSSATNDYLLQSGFRLYRGMHPDYFYTNFDLNELSGS